MTIQESLDALLNKVKLFLQNFCKNNLENRKLLLVTESGIKSITLSVRTQLIIASTVLIIFIWVFLSTIKFFGIIGNNPYKKEVISTLSESNEELQERIDFLNKNLNKVNKYFDSLNKIKNRKSFNSKFKKPKDISKFNEEEILSYKIKHEIIERIKYIENAMKISGLSLEGKDFKSKNEAQGGIFIPNPNQIGFDYSMFANSINHLIILENTINYIPSSKPISTNYRISSKYGVRKDPLNHKRAVHNGLDIVGSKNSKVKSTADGVVSFAGKNGGYGLMVEIQHKRGFKTRYAHLKEINVKNGQYVKRNKIIGTQGSTGRSTGDHLHYEILLQDTHLDPNNFINLGKYLF